MEKGPCQTYATGISVECFQAYFNYIMFLFMYVNIWIHNQKCHYETVTYRSKVVFWSYMYCTQIMIILWFNDIRTSEGCVIIFFRGPPQKIITCLLLLENAVPKMAWGRQQGDAFWMWSFSCAEGCWPFVCIHLKVNKLYSDTDFIEVHLRLNTVMIIGNSYWSKIVEVEQWYSPRLKCNQGDRA